MSISERETTELDKVHDTVLPNPGPLFVNASLIQ